MEESYFDSENGNFPIDAPTDEKISDCENLPQSQVLPVPKKRVRFSRTHVFYFSRQQGHSSVPQRGGCSLGMASVHFHSEVYKESAFRKMRLNERITSIVNNFKIPSQPSGRGRRRKYNQPRVLLVPSSENIEEPFNNGNDRRVPLYEVTESELTQTVIVPTPSPLCLSPQTDVISTEYPTDISETDSENSIESINIPNTKKLIPLPPAARTRLLKQAGKK